ncbi:MAG: DMT family transporter [Rhizobiaceae bacterium]
MNTSKNLHATGLEKLKGHLAMLLFAALISASFSIGHLAAPHIDPVALTTVRFMLAVIVMSVAASIFYQELPTIWKDVWRFLLLGGLMAIYFVTMFIALRITSPVSTGAVFTLIPLMSAVFGWIFLRQSTSLVVILSLLMAAAGAIWVIFRGDIQAILAFKIGAGETIFFFGCLAHAAYAPLVRKFNQGEPVFNFTYMTLIASTLCMIAWGGGTVLETDWTNLPVIVWITIGYLAVFTTAGTFFLLQYSSLRLPASKVLAYGYLVPGIIVLYEGFLGHGWVRLSLLIGVLVTAAALVLLAASKDT